MSRPKEAILKWLYNTRDKSNKAKSLPQLSKLKYQIELGKESQTNFTHLQSPQRTFLNQGDWPCTKSKYGNLISKH